MAIKIRSFEILVKDVNPCWPDNPCINGGTCIIVNENDWKCECPPGYSGAQCENCEIFKMYIYKIFPMLKSICLIILNIPQK